MNLTEGRRRFRLVSVSLSGGLCTLFMVVVLIVYGTPYNPVWWPVMAVILAASFVGPALVAPLFEWVLKGYLQGQDRD